MEDSMKDTDNDVVKQSNVVAKKSVHTPDTTARCVRLLRNCDALDTRIANFQAKQPAVEGMDKLRRAVSREREVALSLQTADDPLRGVTGLENNLRGFQLELECASWAPEVTAVRKRFARRSPSIEKKLEDDEVVEVDVVAQNGALWIECKAEKGRVATGLVQQALELQKVAKAPCNLRPYGVAPKVCVFLTGALGEHEARVLHKAGITTLGVGGQNGSAALDPRNVLPPPPKPVTTANLDITALFALVSEVSAPTSGSFVTFLDDPAVREWAAKKTQHAACLTAELEDPLHLEKHLLEYDRLVAHPSVLRRFAKILANMGGPREQRRWEEVWRHRVEVLEVPIDMDARVEARKTQVRQLDRITKPQLDAFELGEASIAKTFTANGRAVMSAAEQGMILDAHVHRAIWLVGL
jgi:hypothetical protein|tara:strand:+ start:4963 stop:6198 length:1236 start_codon:yes stop_codon:yes gene_type:complete